MIKRIQTKQDRERRSKRNNWILAGVLIFVMFGSVFGVVVNSFGSGSQSESITYNGFIFLNENGAYSTQVGSSRFYFSNNPQDTDSISKEVSLFKTLSDYSGTVYISSEDYPSFVEIQGNLYPYADVVQACKEGEPCTDETLPKKTCLDNMILIKVSEENKIYESSNCVYIEGKERDLLKLTDEFLLRIIGIK